MNWVEKYRPNTLNDIKDQNNIVNSLKKILITKNMPHLLFHGPPGCGKTTSILALAQDIFKEEYNNRVIELNASDERGINVIRDKIKTYARQTINNNNNNLPKWKIIILDEADNLTSDSFFALRRIIEEYSKITRFCIICNHFNKIIDPIVSRCCIFKFNLINNENIFNQLKYISLNENYIIEDNIINKIVEISNNDLRKAINILENCYYSFRYTINENILNEISGQINNLNDLMNYIFSKDIENLNLFINNFLINGYSLSLQIKLIHNYIINNEKINCYQKSKILDLLIIINLNLNKGCDEYIQFMKLCYFIINII